MTERTILTLVGNKGDLDDIKTWLDDECIGEGVESQFVLTGDVATTLAVVGAIVAVTEQLLRMAEWYSERPSNQKKSDRVVIVLPNGKSVGLDKESVEALEADLRRIASLPDDSLPDGQ